MLLAAVLTQATFTNPIRLGADPWLTHSRGQYHLAVTSGRNVTLQSARRLRDLGTAPERVVWQDADPRYNHDVWAPDFARYESGRGPRWYLYVTGGDGAEPSHRMTVAESVRDDIRGPYRLKARLRTDPKDSEYAIDMTTPRTPDGRLYALWCGRPSPYGQGLYVSRMANPWTLTGERAHLDASGFGSPIVREGPAILQRKGKIYLIYSASPTDLPDYKLGLLVADARADLTNPKAWVQRPEPVFTRRDEVEMYGPGHNSFFKSPDGREDWIAYHAKAGAAATYADRFTHAQRFTWGRNGDPIFGRPLDPKIPVRAPSGER